jgi:hypothetical protein
MTSPLTSLASHPEAQMSCSSLGRSLVYLARRRPVKTSAQDCEIRGGEYVSYDRSDSATALKIWLRQAREGDKVAQTYVGEIYETGLGFSLVMSPPLNGIERLLSKDTNRRKLIWGISMKSPRRRGRSNDGVGPVP